MRMRVVALSRTPENLQSTHRSLRSLHMLRSPRILGDRPSQAQRHQTFVSAVVPRLIAVAMQVRCVGVDADALVIRPSHSNREWKTDRTERDRRRNQLQLQGKLAICPICLICRKMTWHLAGTRWHERCTRGSFPLGGHRCDDQALPKLWSAPTTKKSSRRQCGRLMASRLRFGTQRVVSRGSQPTRQSQLRLEQNAPPAVLATMTAASITSRTSSPRRTAERTFN